MVSLDASVRILRLMLQLPNEWRCSVHWDGLLDHNLSHLTYRVGRQQLTCVSVGDYASKNRVSSTRT
jgi:hypothetical protein